MLVTVVLESVSLMVQENWRVGISLCGGLFPRVGGNRDLERNTEKSQKCDYELGEILSLTYLVVVSAGHGTNVISDVHSFSGKPGGLILPGSNQDKHHRYGLQRHSLYWTLFTILSWAPKGPSP